MGLLIKNRYYSDYGLDYVHARLKDALKKLGLELSEAPAITMGYSADGRYFLSPSPDADFVVFWDKDIRLAKALEKKFGSIYPNGSLALELCDDKEKTYAAIEGSGILVPDTIIAPLVFDVNSAKDSGFLSYVAEKLGFPVVIKENTGSQGRQVYLAESMRELADINKKLIHIPHHYQKFVGERGRDIRVYVIGGEATAGAVRSNTTDFKSNVAMGGNMELYAISEEMSSAAVKIAKLLKMEYGSVDFLMCDRPVFLEANSNAYFKGIESLGVDIAGKLAASIASKVLAGRN